MDRKKSALIRINVLIAKKNPTKKIAKTQMVIADQSDQPPTLNFEVDKSLALDKVFVSSFGKNKTKIMKRKWD